MLPVTREKVANKILKKIHYHSKQKTLQNPNDNSIHKLLYRNCNHAIEGLNAATRSVIKEITINIFIVITIEHGEENMFIVYRRDFDGFLRWKWGWLSSDAQISEEIRSFSNFMF